MTWAPRKLVLAPIDLVEDNFESLDTALEFADAKAVHALYVLPDLSPLEMGELWTMVNDDSRIRQAKIAMKERLADPKYANIVHDVRMGDPGGAIAEAAKELGADLIVIPSHGRTGIARMFLGSVAERVIRLAHCPVLVLRK